MPELPIPYTGRKVPRPDGVDKRIFAEQNADWFAQLVGLRQEALRTTGTTGLKPKDIKADYAKLKERLEHHFGPKGKGTPLAEEDLRKIWNDLMTNQIEHPEKLAMAPGTVLAGEVRGNAITVALEETPILRMRKMLVNAAEIGPGIPLADRMKIIQDAAGSVVSTSEVAAFREAFGQKAGFPLRICDQHFKEVIGRLSTEQLTELTGSTEAMARVSDCADQYYRHLLAVEAPDGRFLGASKNIVRDALTGGGVYPGEDRVRQIISGEVVIAAPGVTPEMTGTAGKRKRAGSIREERRTGKGTRTGKEGGTGLPPGDTPVETPAVVEPSDAGAREALERLERERAAAVDEAEALKIKLGEAEGRVTQAVGEHEATKGLLEEARRNSRVYVATPETSWQINALKKENTLLRSENELLQSGKKTLTNALERGNTGQLLEHGGALGVLAAAGLGTAYLLGRLNRKPAAKAAQPAEDKTALKPEARIEVGAISGPREHNRAQWHEHVKEEGRHQSHADPQEKGSATDAGHAARLSRQRDKASRDTERETRH